MNGTRKVSIQRPVVADRSNERGHLRYGSAVTWLLATVTAMLCANFLSDFAGVLMLGVIGILHSTVYFLKEGDNRINASAVYAFGTAIFIYFPAIYTYTEPPSVDYQFAVAAVVFCLVSQIFIFHFVVPFFSAGFPYAVSFRSGTMSRVATWLFVFNVMNYFAIYLGLNLPIGNDPIAYVLLVLFALASSRSNFSTLITLPMCGLFIILYSVLVFDGFGRLSIGSLSLAVALVYSSRWPDLRVKISLVLATWPVMAYMIAWRTEFTAVELGQEYSEGSGIGSILAPFYRFAQLLQIDSTGMLELARFDTLWATLVVWIPRSLWPSKPVGFGAELAAIFNPHLADYGHSDAASAFGEIFYSFGFVGLVLSPLLIGLAVAALNRALVRMECGRPPIALYAAVVVLVTGIVDYVWNGTFTYVARAALRVGVLLLFAVMFSRIRTPLIVESPSRAA